MPAGVGGVRDCVAGAQALALHQRRAQRVPPRQRAKLSRLRGHGAQCSAPPARAATHLWAHARELPHQVLHRACQRRRLCDRVAAVGVDDL